MFDKVQTFKREKLKVNIYPDRNKMGKAAAKFVAAKLNDAINENSSANMILATGTSQFTFLDNLQKEKIDWDYITVFHLDEYMGISDKHPASFRNYLRKRILEKVCPKQVYYLNGDAEDLEAELIRYENLLKDHEIDIACIGIGENGHIAFNDPPVADFNDKRLVKIVELDEVCRRQQFGEGWFPKMEDVPTHALTLTIPAIMRCRNISCVVPDERKAEAVYNTLNAEISTACPATILRQHPRAVLHLDRGASSKLN